MLSPVIPFGDWTPDLGSLNNTGAITVNNVLALGKDRYKPAKNLKALTGAIDARAQGAIAFITESGQTETIVGDETHLYRIGTSVVTDGSDSIVYFASPTDIVITGGGNFEFANITRTSSNYATAIDDRWKFALYGRKVYATNFNDAIQVLDLDSDTNFKNLSTISTGTPPRARCLAIVGNFLVTFHDVDSTDGEKYNRVRWAGIDDPTYWTISAIQQSDQQDVYGDAQGKGTEIISFGEYAILIFQREIWRMEYVGSPLIFTFKRVSSGIGSLYEGSVAKADTKFFFYSANGFHMHDQNQAIPIGEGRINNEFKRIADPSYLSRMYAAHDGQENSIRWAFASQGSLGVLDKQLVYNYIYDKWTMINVQCDMIFNSITRSIDIDSLDSLYTNIDAIPFSLDSSAFLGGIDNLGGFTTEHRAGFFNGDNLIGEIETAEVRLNAAGAAFVRGVVPVIDDAAPTAKIFSRNSQSGTFLESPYKALNTRSGVAEFKTEARYHKARIKTSGDYTIAQGIQIDYEKAGEL